MATRGREPAFAITVPANPFQGYMGLFAAMAAITLYGLGRTMPAAVAGAVCILVWSAARELRFPRPRTMTERFVILGLLRIPGRTSDLRRVILREEHVIDDEGDERTIYRVVLDARARSVEIDATEDLGEARSRAASLAGDLDLEQVDLTSRSRGG